VATRRAGLTGRYVANGAIVRLLYHRLHVQDRWVFRKLNGEITLWRPNAIAWWHMDRSFDYFGVLYRMDRPAEEVWHDPMLWRARP
jgi:hypothetical protein